MKETTYKVRKVGSIQQAKSTNVLSASKTQTCISSNVVDSQPKIANFHSPPSSRGNWNLAGNLYIT